MGKHGGVNMASWKITNKWMLSWENMGKSTPNGRWLIAIFDKWMQVAKTQRNCRYSKHIGGCCWQKIELLYIPLESLECKSNGMWIDIIEL